MENEKIFIRGGERFPAEILPVPSYFERTGQRLVSNGIWLGTQVVGVLILALVGIAAAPVFGDGRNLANIGSMFVSIALPAAAMMIVFANGSLDLSMGGTAVFVAAVTAQLAAGGTPPAIAVGAGILVALLVGLLNGALIGAARLPGILVTLLVGLALRGLSMQITQGQPIHAADLAGGMPALGWIVFIPILGLAVLWLQAPAFNVRLFKSESGFARLARIGAPYLVTGLAAGIAGCAMLGRLTVFLPNIGQNLEINALVTVVFAGACFGGRYGNPIAVLLAALALCVVQNLMSLLAVDMALQFIVIGLLGLLGLGYLYLYHFVAGLIFRNASGRKGAIAAETP